MSLRLAAEFAGSYSLRMHIDCNHDESTLVYPYYKTTLLSLIQNDPEFPTLERKKILRHTGEAIQELHSKGWIHIDVKPDNILVNWISDSNGNKTVADVALGDFDIAYKLEDGQSRQTPYAIGNAMWRSPEGHTGTGVTKASDIFSYGLVFSEGLLKQIENENWRSALKAAGAVAEEAVKEEPMLRFTHWGAELGPEAQNMISGMTNPDPTARTTISQVLAHRWWQDNTI
ncbi:Putative protein kinase [Colletotrichum destructivum]|uniref:Protein kinase domain-containing protein n=1 Tax=Colletotrichum destructivum TaxID=34406 RepID=A0AAX4II43_9PEZI|nr:Putative protein kinase [Colletotrichum destructivum]